MFSIDTAATTPSTPRERQDLRSRPAVSRRREKVQLSCNLCRRRKLKCDRKQPCGTCSSRGLSLSCTYVPQSSPTGTQHAEQSQKHLQDRLGQLEGLVLSLINKAGPREGGLLEVPDLPRLPGSYSEENSESSLPDDFGRMSLQASETSYVGREHWIAILDGITELKDHFHEPLMISDTHLPEDRDPSGDVPALLCGGGIQITKDDVLASLPPRPVVDRLVSRYFNAMDMAPYILHSGHFLDEYADFWTNSTVASPMWLGLLFGIMCLASQFEHCSTQSGISPSTTPQGSHSRVQQYREKIVQCLVLGKYTRPGPCTVETLLLYFTVEHFMRQDTDIGTWILLGIIVRISFRMGYHIDPSHSPGISPFQGEMRRRVWATILQVDLAVSDQMGLPRMIKEWQSNTMEPRNLRDGDFAANSTSLPPSRPDTELTPVLYLLAKHRIALIFGSISDLATATRQCHYSEIVRLDGLLQEASKAIPASLKLKSMAQSITDSPHTIMQRIYLEIMFRKAQCVLHRKYLLPARTNPQYSHSRQACLHAALAILQHQVTIDEETKPGGQLYDIRWKVSSLVNHEFLLATTILCVELNHDVASSRPSEEDRVTELRQALWRSYDIWQRSSNSSKDAEKAAEALKIVLEKGHEATSHATNSFSVFENAQSGFLGWPFSLLSGGTGTDNLMEGSPSFTFNEFILPVESQIMGSSAGPLSPRAVDPTESSTINSLWNMDG